MYFELGVWPVRFLELVDDPLTLSRLANAAEYGAAHDWRMACAAAVARSCSERGLAVAVKDPPVPRLPALGGDLLGFDLLAFPDDLAECVLTPWPLPVAAFAFETDDDEQAAHLFWRLLATQAELRVLLVYRPTWDAARTVAGKLQADVLDGLVPAQAAAITGETYVVLGSRAAGEPTAEGLFDILTVDRSAKCLKSRMTSAM